ncbi:hypothetical protein RB623_05080 [Mesorhizobium sp. LHD-90]|uniref:hypothetical protein n=1 Tax=Mesorhizobium sp. LHD-90 TaxID=3071414 RepID=UPI0027DF62BF|nr:hypothetical protein [Mesorhizobium sp. LHD-90]MDQ6433422.1 hypothetical protein [Mesorhizobium sp. LHD-90]
MEWFEGNFEEYEKDKARRLGPEALVPHRMTHKRLTRVVDPRCNIEVLYLVASCKPETSPWKTSTGWTTSAQN